MFKSNPAVSFTQFGNLFELKPAEVNKFLHDHGGLETVVATLEAGGYIPKAERVVSKGTKAV